MLTYRQVAKGKNKLAELEDKILYLLATATGSLLDDDALVNTLQSSKTISNDVSEQARELLCSSPCLIVCIS